MKTSFSFDIVIRVATLFIIVGNIVLGIYNKNLPSILGWVVAFIYGVEYLIVKYRS